MASREGTKPSNVREPFIIGTPATATLSLIAMRLPARRSSAGFCAVIDVATYHAPRALSSSARKRCSRWGADGAADWYNSSTTS